MPRIPFNSAAGASLTMTTAPGLSLSLTRTTAPGWRLSCNIITKSQFLAAYKQPGATHHMSGYYVMKIEQLRLKIAENGTYL